MVATPRIRPADVIVRCRNVEGSVAELFEGLDALRSKGYREWSAVLVDDASTDGTLASLLLSSRTREWVQVVHQPVKAGMGEAIRIGLARSNADIVCTVDSESGYALERLRDLTRIIDDGADIVSAVGAFGGEPRDGNRSLRARMVRAVSQLSRSVTGCDSLTLTSPFRAYRRDVLGRVNFRCNGPLSQLEIMVRGLAAGLDVRLAPIVAEPRVDPVQRERLMMVLAVALALTMLRCVQTMRILMHRHSTVTRAVSVTLTYPLALAVPPRIRSVPTKRPQSDGFSGDCGDAAAN